MDDMTESFIGVGLTHRVAALEEKTKSHWNGVLLSGAGMGDGRGHTLLHSRWRAMILLAAKGRLSSEGEDVSGHSFTTMEFVSFFISFARADLRRTWSIDRRLSVLFHLGTLGEKRADLERGNHRGWTASHKKLFRRCAKGQSLGHTGLCVVGRGSSERTLYLLLPVSWMVHLGQCTRGKHWDPAVHVTACVMPSPGRCGARSQENTSFPPIDTAEHHVRPSSLLPRDVGAQHRQLDRAYDVAQASRRPRHGLYTDESPGLKVDPFVVMVLSIGFIISVVALHSELSTPAFLLSFARKGESWIVLTVGFRQSSPRSPSGSHRESLASAFSGWQGSGPGHPGSVSRGREEIYIFCVWMAAARSHRP
nr:protein transport protein sec61 subunit beta [Quercus suber]